MLTNINKPCDKKVGRFFFSFFFFSWGKQNVRGLIVQESFNWCWKEDLKEFIYTEGLGEEGQVKKDKKPRGGVSAVSSA